MSKLVTTIRKRVKADTRIVNRGIEVGSMNHDDEHFLVLEIRNSDETIQLKQSESSYIITFMGKKSFASMKIQATEILSNLWEELSSHSIVGTLV